VKTLIQNRNLKAELNASVHEQVKLLTVLCNVLFRSYSSLLCLFLFLYTYCDVLPVNASNNLWVSDFISRFIGYTSGEVYTC
jgi:hypothetical protein